MSVKATMQEPFKRRWQRRAMTIPAMLGLTAVAVIGFPLLAPLALAADLVRLRFRLPTIRMYLFLIQYVVNDTVEIMLSPVLWLAGGFGLRLQSAASIARHERLQWWSLRLLAKRAEQLLGLRIELTPDSEDALTPGPAIVLCRHVSMIDASLPPLLYQSRGLHIRGVIMAEMLSDPGFDLLYGRLGSIFIPRDNGPDAKAAVQAMATGLDNETVAVIFPEGRLFRPSVLERALTRLSETSPERAEHLASLSRVLPPRPGGVLALLDAVPEADVVVIDHVGLEEYGKFGDLPSAVPLRDPIRVSARRISRQEIPDDPQDQVAWLDDVWLTLDRREEIIFTKS